MLQGPRESNLQGREALSSISVAVIRGSNQHRMKSLTSRLLCARAKR
jgi:hypothetical protein